MTPLPVTPIRVIVLAALICGILDITCTLALSRLKGITPKRLLQTITSALLGSKSFQGGVSTAIIGLMIHFFIAFIAAAIYFAAAHQLSVSLGRAALFGLFYGTAVHLFMTFVALPLSALQRPFSAKAFVTQWIIHIAFVGLPIALIVQHFS